MSTLASAAAATRTARSETWRRQLVALVAVTAAILLLFYADLAHMVSIWWASDTFNHCFLIPPIIGWLVWQRRAELARLTPQAWIPGLLLVGAGGCGWLLGEAAGVALARHAGLVLMLQGAVLACLGPAVGRALAFPIFFALFLIPLGEELVPAMQILTAKMAMALLDLVGIPAHIDGIHISTPTALFVVAEACAGVKFLVAMIAYGALVANVCFRSWRRRALFMAAAVAIPILANGVRAWGTIYIAHLTDVEFASGFDHVFYGWIFFAVVIALIMAAGWRFFDRGIDEPWFDPAALQPSPPHVASAALPVVAAAAVALAVVPVAWSAGLAATADRPRVDLRLPQVPGWTPVGAASDWRPHYAGADAVRVGRYRNAAGQEVDLAIALFTDQEEGREVVAFGQGIAASDNGWRWVQDMAPPPGGRAARIVSDGRIREVATFYRIGDVVTGSPMAVKIETMKVRLFGGDRRALAVHVSAVAPAAGVSPRPAIDAFLADLGPIAALAD